MAWQAFTARRFRITARKTAARFSSGTQAVETSFPTADSAPPVLSVMADTWLCRMCRMVYTASGQQKKDSLPCRVVISRFAC